MSTTVGCPSCHLEELEKRLQDPALWDNLKEAMTRRGWRFFHFLRDGSSIWRPEVRKAGRCHEIQVPPPQSPYHPSSMAEHLLMMIRRLAEFDGSKCECAVLREVIGESHGH